VLIATATSTEIASAKMKDGIQQLNDGEHSSPEYSSCPTRPDTKKRDTVSI
jgi:hypothetical protein